MPRVVVGELDDHRALVFGQRRRNLLDEGLLELNIHRRKHFVFVNRLEQLLVLVLALFFRVRERRDVPLFVVDLDLLRALFRELEEFF
jgi:hypothetical protein